MWAETGNNRTVLLNCLVGKFSYAISIRHHHESNMKLFIASKQHLMEHRRVFVAKSYKILTQDYSALFALKDCTLYSDINLIDISETCCKVLHYLNV